MRKEIEEVIGLDTSNAILASAKRVRTGLVSALGYCFASLLRRALDSS